MEIRALLRRIQETTGVTILHVTHNRQDAEALANRVLLLEDGRISEGVSRAFETGARRPANSGRLIAGRAPAGGRASAVRIGLAGAIGRMRMASQGAASRG